MKPVIVGGGLAGLTAALALAPQPVIVLSPYRLGEECSSGWAQGGLAAAVGPDDHPALHAEDTMKAGAGLCREDIARAATEDGPNIIEALLAKGVPFDRDAAGHVRLGLEAAHSRRRIVHAADATGAAVMKALISIVRTTPSVEIVENALAVELPTDQNGVAGVVIEREGNLSALAARQVVLATGGAGALWRQTSNPLGSWGRGLLLAARAGAALGNLEFMQFHPTCIDAGRDPMPLASEALRGEGCVLIDDKGERFVDELQPRDIVARAIARHYAEGHRVFLDGRKALGENFAKRFPSVHALCLASGIDPAATPVPVRPAAHYHMGGIMTDARGRSSVEGLWACGEVACTGLHGANRLASNSLLEAASFGRRVAEDVAGCEPPKPAQLLIKVKPRRENADSIPAIRDLMSHYVGVVRDAAGLRQAVRELTLLADSSGMAQVGLMIAVAALRREESRGAHARSDFPAADPAWQHDQLVTLEDIRSNSVPSPLMGEG